MKINCLDLSQFKNPESIQIHSITLISHVEHLLLFSFFGLHPLSQVLDRTNPLTQIVHGRKLSYLGPGGLTARTASFRMRDIHPSYYGRICPIDTSEGINVGLIGSLAIHARIGRGGSLESPFYEISERSNKGRMLYFSPSRDERRRKFVIIFWIIHEITANKSLILFTNLMLINLRT